MRLGRLTGSLLLPFAGAVGVGAGASARGGDGALNVSGGGLCALVSIGDEMSREWMLFTIVVSSEGEELTLLVFPVAIRSIIYVRTQDTCREYSQSYWLLHRA